MLIPYLLLPLALLAVWAAATGRERVAAACGGAMLVLVAFATAWATRALLELAVHVADARPAERIANLSAIEFANGWLLCAVLPLLVAGGARLAVRRRDASAEDWSVFLIAVAEATSAVVLAILPRWLSSPPDQIAAVYARDLTQATAAHALAVVVVVGCASALASTRRPAAMGVAACLALAAAVDNPVWIGVLQHVVRSR